MAPIKGVPVPTTGLSSKKRGIKPEETSSRNHPLKKQKRDEAATPTKFNGQDNKPNVSYTSSRPNPTYTSVLRDEEPAFPRGGASVLTPLEYKQIKADATRDVLFEQSNPKTVRHGSDDEVEDASAATAAPPRKKRPGKSKGKPAPADTTNEEKAVRIQGLTYKRIAPGSMVLGQVSQINPNDISLALPNDLTGYIPLTSISTKFTEKLEASIEHDSDQEEAGGAGAEQKEAVDLKDFFYLGQYLRAYVVSTSEDSLVQGITKHKKRIELSVNPQQANSSLTASNLVDHVMLQASVHSVEDHGLVMDLGLKDDTIKGFISSKEVGKRIEYDNIEEGTVFLCRIIGRNSSGKTIKLSADMEKSGDLRKSNYLSDAPTVDAFLPGTAVEVLVDEVTHAGFAGKVMGMLDVTADVVHSGLAINQKNISNSLKIGSKIKCRIICDFPTSDIKTLGVSLLEHVLSFSPEVQDGVAKTLAISSIIEGVTVLRVEPRIGLFVDLGIKGAEGFVHISRISDKKIDTISDSIGAYKLGSTHKARVVGYNPMDGLHTLSMEQKVIEQPYLRVDDIQVGEIVKGKIERLIVNAVGLGGTLVNISEGISGLVPEMHLSDVKLSHPERKFKEGMSVTARVLSKAPEKRQFRLTLKKSLVNSDATIFKSYSEINAGDQSPGTLVNILPNGAVVQFYGDVRAFLPISEMSEAYIEDPKQHFRVGQVVNVHVLSVDSDRQKMSVSCRDPAAFGPEQQAALSDLAVASVVTGQVTEKSDDDVTILLKSSGLKGTLPAAHLTDGSDKKGVSMLKTLRVGQMLNDLVVLEKDTNKRLVILSNKPSLVEAAKSNSLISSFEDVSEGRTVKGFVKRIILSGVVVQFAGGVTGLLLKSQIPDDQSTLADFGMKPFRSISARVMSVDHNSRKFLLSQRDGTDAVDPKKSSIGDQTSGETKAINPVDGSSTSIESFTVGQITKAKVASIKATQLNVVLAENVQGRVDVSATFDSWDEIKDRKRPLQIFKPQQTIAVRILGMHDARNHRFLPITHRTGRVPVFELSAKPSDQEEGELNLLTLEKIKAGSSWLAFINNIADDCVWVNLSPNVRGRIRHIDLSDDVSLLKDVDNNFPIGSALRVRVTGIDLKHSRLDLSARSSNSSGPLTFDTLTKGTVLPGRVTKVSERLLIVQLESTIAGPIFLTELEDDYDKANPTTYVKDEIVRVCVTDVDIPNKKVSLSTRPSKVLNSSLPVKDPEILKINQLNVNDVVRGFVKNVADSGLFVSLGPNVTAYVRVSDLSDSFIKDWKSKFTVDQLVKGKVTALDPLLNHVQMSLKDSVLDKSYVPPLSFTDFEVGQVVTGKVRKVEDFGAFIVIDGSMNVSGLCHRSEIADQRVEDVSKLYEENDAVKAIILKIDLEKRRISFGLKASYFEDLDEDDEVNTEDSDEDRIVLEASDDEDEDGSEGEDDPDEDEDEDLEDGGVDLSAAADLDGDSVDEDSDVEMDDVDGEKPIPVTGGLKTAGFDWRGDLGLESHQRDSESEASSSDTREKPRKKRHHKATIKPEDLTGTLDANGPQSVSDFERLLLSQPSSSYLWLSYMAFQLQLSEVDKAREVAARALRTIDLTEQTEKMNVWIAWLNLENTYGSQESVEDIFSRACEVCDPKEIGEKLISTYIQSGKNDQASALYDTLLSRPPSSPALWHNYLSFLMGTAHEPAKARTTLSRAMQSLPQHTHVQLTSQFACLEFRAEAGDAERGRTIFEGLVDTWPKRWDLWGIWLDMEMVVAETAAKALHAPSEDTGNKKRKQQRGNQDSAAAEDLATACQRVRALFERILKVKGLKPRKASKLFKRWIAWEEKSDGPANALKTGEKDKSKRVGTVKAKAADFVRQHAQGKDDGAE
ncbi:MAG: hypothetical protein M4579_004502 [Chaenotheca gracillima]|nr:MAG: hypothetical protein M4579_004502 [Chaenotheca gracillima]